MDLTYHRDRAQEFDDLATWFRKAEGEDECCTVLHGDLRSVSRGWAYEQQDHTVNTNANLSPIPDDHHHQNGTGDTPRLLAADQAAASDIAFNESKQNDNSHNQPNASTHVFLFRWKDWEAEKRFKQPLQQGITGGLGKLGRLEWKTGFEDLQEGWMKEGMRVERYPLSSGRLFSLR